MMITVDRGKVWNSTKALSQKLEERGVRQRSPLPLTFFSGWEQLQTNIFLGGKSRL